MKSYVPIGLVTALLVLASLACQTARSPQASGQEKPITKVTMAIATPKLDIYNANMALAGYLGYYKEEGLEVDFQPVTGGGGEATQLVLTGGAEFGLILLDPLMSVLGGGTAAGARFFYNNTREGVAPYAAVPLDSPIKDYRDLKGKKIGVQTQAPSSLAFPKAAIKTYGLDPDKDVEWLPVGVGGTIIAAVNSGQVDAIWHVNSIIAQAEVQGLKVRYLPKVPLAKQLMGTGISARDELLKNRPHLASGLGRAVAKATVFMLENPEAAIKIMYKLYPDLKPAGKSDEDALKEGKFLIDTRLDALRIEGRKVPKWGAYDKEEMEFYTKFVGLEDKIKDVRTIYSDEFVNEFNKFDPAPIKKAAREFKNP